MRDIVIAAIRTTVQAGVVAAAAYFTGLGFDVDPTALEAAVLPIVVGLVTLVLNWLQTKFPWIGSILSLGASKSTPSY